jgi:hypothetical protein
LAPKGIFFAISDVGGGGKNIVMINPFNFLVLFLQNVIEFRVRALKQRRGEEFRPKSPGIDAVFGTIPPVFKITYYNTGNACARKYCDREKDQ